MSEPAIAATINDRLIHLAPDRTLSLKDLHDTEHSTTIVLTPGQVEALYAFFQRPDVAARLEDVRAD